MRLPAPLLRHNPNVYKNQFGHVLVIAGSARMLGAAALCGLAAMRTGSGLVTIGVPKSLNRTLQAKVSNVIMTLPLPENHDGSISAGAFSFVKKLFSNYQAVAIGPGLAQSKNKQKFVLDMIHQCPLPMVVDAEALNILAKNIRLLDQAMGERILTPHVGEMSRLSGLSHQLIEKDRLSIAKQFAQRYKCFLVLKGHRSCVASKDGRAYINKSGNSGMATAGSGDVLTGMIAALLGQKVLPFESAKFGCYLHGLCGDRSALKIGKASLIATDLIEAIPEVLKRKL